MSTSYCVLTLFKLAGQWKLPNNRHRDRYKAFAERLPKIKEKYEKRRKPKSLRIAIRRLKEEQRRGLHEAQSRLRAENQKRCQPINFEDQRKLDRPKDLIDLFKYLGIERSY